MCCLGVCFASGGLPDGRVTAGEVAAFHVILLQPELGGGATKSLCSPASVVLAVGTSVIVSGLTGAPELNGRTGVVEGFDDEKGRCSVHVEGRKKPAALRPQNCEAWRLGLEAPLYEQQLIQQLL